MRSAPRRCAAAAPRTATGSRAVAAFSHRPCARDVPTVAGRPMLAASTVRALVLMAGISGLRKTLTLLTVLVSWTEVTPFSCPIIAGAALGSSAVPPVRLCPFCAVSRLVPSLLISASSPACEEADRPSTATIAATPIAIPSADREARSLRVRSPTAARRARSAGRRRRRYSRDGRAAGAGPEGRVAAVIVGFLGAGLPGRRGRVPGGGRAGGGRG